MRCTNNKCLGVLYMLLFFLVAVPLMVSIYIVVFIIYQLYQLLTCGYQCCTSENFDTPGGSHHANGSFINPWSSALNAPIWRILLIMWDMRPVTATEEQECRLPLDKVNYTKLKEYFNASNNENNNNIQYTWMGHASSLIQCDGFNILTDPVYSDRCSAFQWAGPKRFTPPPEGVWDAENLPEIDILLISHDHYDHLDYNTIKYLYTNNKVKYYCVPLRIGTWLKDSFKIPKEKIYELDWWQSITINYSGNLNNNDKNYHTFSEPKMDETKSGATSHDALIDEATKTTQSQESNDNSNNNISSASNSSDKNVKFMNNSIRVTCTPCQHFSGRTLFDRRHRLWSSWVVETFNNNNIDNNDNNNNDKNNGNLLHNLYFAGDTGYRTVPRNIYKLSENGKLEISQNRCCFKNLYFAGGQNWDARDKTIINKEKELDTCPVFKEIGDKYGPFDVAMLPIGAYSPRWFMSCVHLNPYDACCVHKDLKAKQSYGIHWGTWVLTDEKLDEPPKLLNEMKSLPEFNIPNDEFIALNPGQTVIVPSK